MMEEDRTLQTMILYMEEGKASWANTGYVESEILPSVGDIHFQRIVDTKQGEIPVLTVIAYRNGEEIHRFKTYLMKYNR